MTPITDKIKQAIELLREGMASTGSSTLHYQKMRDAVELLVPSKRVSSSLDGRVLKDSYRTAKNYNLVCECGHKNGRHWYLKLDRATDKSVTASWDCRDCKCPRFNRATEAK